MGFGPQLARVAATAAAHMTVKMRRVAFSRVERGSRGLRIVCIPECNARRIGDLPIVNRYCR